MLYIIGVDDTDNLESRGTGYLVRQLAKHLADLKLFEPHVILRHQLYVHDDIPYTSHNSSASIKGRLLGSSQALISACEDFVFTHSADGSDAGLCICPANTDSTPELIEWGLLAKKQILDMDKATALAVQSGLFLKGLTGLKTGIIGALAAVGLNLFASDGRVLWLPYLRETKGVMNVKQIMNTMGVQVIMEYDGQAVGDQARVMLGEWSRPVAAEKKIVLYVEKEKCNEYEYKTASKSFIKSISE